MKSFVCGANHFITNSAQMLCHFRIRKTAMWTTAPQRHNVSNIGEHQKGFLVVYCSILSSNRINSDVGPHIRLTRYRLLNA